MQYGRAASVLVVPWLALACSGQSPAAPGVEAGAPGPVDALLGADTAPPPGPDAAPPGDAGASPDTGPPLVSGCSTPLPAPLRRLSTVQYLRTVKELTGLSLTTALDPDFTGEDGLDNVLDAMPLRVAAWNRAADEIVSGVKPRLNELTDCAGALDDACTRAFISRFGGRAFRRPLTPGELEAHFLLFTRVRDLGDASDGIAAVVQAMFQSPHFLYRVELGGPPSAGALVPGPFEVATRLSYFLWGNMPDAELFDAAARNELARTDQVAAQARRMMLDLRARQGSNDFFRQWLGLDDVLRREKNTARVPDWKTALAPALREEGYRFTQGVLFDGDGKFASLFTAPETWANERLGQLYGLPVTGSAWQRVSLAGQPRLGLLTQGWFLASQASDTDSNPSRRGVFIRSRIFCQLVPPEPPSVPPTDPPKPMGTTRDRFQAHIANPACASCHALMDPLGFPFEAYDGLGVFRTTDNSKPVDTSGEIRGTDADGPVTDALALSRRVAGSALARECLGRRWYQLAVGHEPGEPDVCGIRELTQRFERSGGDMRQLVMDVAVLAALAPRPMTEVAPPRPGQPLLSDPRTANKMVLDLVGAQVAQLRQRLTSPGDQLRLDAHLEGLRDLERRMP